jgi:flagellin
MMNTAIRRLSTGLRINSGQDDPSGLIAVQQLDAEIKAIDAAAENARRADSVLSVADAGLTEVNSLLTEIQGLVVANAGTTLTDAEKAANQTQIDSAIGAIDRIIGSTSFAGKRLLDGTQAISVNGVNTSNLTGVDITGRPDTTSDIALSVNVSTAATQATVSGYATTSASSATQITVTGNLGTASISISTGENLSSVASKINAASGQTGVTASATAANDNLSLVAQDYGDDGFVTVSTISGDSTNYADQSKTSGTDAVVTVNGQTASVDGVDVSFNVSGVSGAFTLSSSFNQTTGSTSFNVSTGGATFALSPDLGDRSTIGISSLSSSNIGSSTLGSLSTVRSGGTNSSTANPAKAVAIVRDAVADVAIARGRIGGFQKHQIQSSINSLTNTSTQLQAAKSSILDADVAAESARLNRAQMLVSSGMTLLGLVNQQQSSVFSLLMGR